MKVWLEIRCDKKVIAKKRLTNLYEMNSKYVYGCTCRPIRPGGSVIERLLWIRQVVGSIPGCDIPNVVKDGTSSSLTYARH